MVPIHGRAGRPPGYVLALDNALSACDRLFLVIANSCLAVMLLGVAVTILLRPVNLSFVWIWPWTMQVFVWMTFFGFFVVYRRSKDIVVDFVIMRLGAGMMFVSRLFVAGVILAVIGTILWQAPVILETQVGVIDGVLTPWGTELERYTLSVPLFVSCALIMANAVLDILKTLCGVPEAVRSHQEVGD